MHLPVLEVETRAARIEVVAEEGEAVAEEMVMVEEMTAAEELAVVEGEAVAIVEMLKTREVQALAMMDVSEPAQ